MLQWRMWDLFNFSDNRKSSYICALSMLLAVTISSIAVFFGFISNLDAYLTIPIVLAGWYGSKRAGYIVAIFSSGLWIYINHLGSFLDIYEVTHLNENAANITAYLILAIIIANFRKFHREEKRAADTDKLTGALNHRGFYADFANEIIRSVRYGHVFSLAYIDIDDFKLINDRFGHSFGDDVLIKTAKALNTTLRSVDLVSRLGGDEFVCLLPETDAKAANSAFLKVKDKLSKIVWGEGLVVRYSIGLVAFEDPPDNVRQALTIADDLMYTVKNNKKNDIAIKIWHDKYNIIKG